MYRLACKLRGPGFGLEEDEITECLEAMNATFCHPQYDEVAMEDFASRACQHDPGYRPWLQPGDMLPDEPQGQRDVSDVVLGSPHQNALEKQYNMNDTGNIDAFLQLYGPTTKYTEELGFLEHPPKPGHFVTSMTCRDGLTALPGHRQRVALR